MGRLFCGGGGCFAEMQSGGQGASEASPQREEAGGGGVAAGEGRGRAGGGRPQGAPAKPGPAASGRRNRPQDGLPCGRGPGWRRGREGRAGGPQARRRSRRHGRSPCVSTQSKRPAAACRPPAQKSGAQTAVKQSPCAADAFYITFCFSHFPLKYRGR